jgi:hypothetical protein
VRLRRLAVLGFAVLIVAIPPAIGATVPPAEENLPVPPIPPDQPPNDVPAPVPNVNLAAPQAPSDDSVALRPTLNEHAPTLPGGDPVPGTLYRSELEQKRQFIPNPGVQLVVPFQK